MGRTGGEADLGVKIKFSDALGCLLHIRGKCQRDSGVEIRLALRGEAGDQNLVMSGKRCYGKSWAWMRPSRE